MPLPSCWTQPLPPSDTHFCERARQRQHVLTKPRGSLGQLEDVAITLVGLQRTQHPQVDPLRIAVFAADHGVCAEGVSAYPQEVTAQMIANFASGGAAISVLARELGASLEVVTLGTVGDVPPLTDVRDEQIAAGTANLATTDAMTPGQLEQALASGDRAAARAADDGCRLFVGGDMGIGNTTSATAVACALLEQSPENLAGPGTGLDAAGVSRKCEVIARALARHGNNRDPLAVLASLGGFEIAALASAIMGLSLIHI